MGNRKNNVFAKKYLLWIILLLVLLIPLFFLRQLTEEQQIVEREATGTGEVRMHIQPTNTTVNPGQTYSTDIILTKTADRTIAISGAQAVLTFDNPLSVISEDNISCGPQFNGLVFKQISGQSVTIMCTVQPGATNVINLTAADLVFASVMITVNSDTSGQNASIQFTATRVTEANDTNQVPDVSTAGETATYTISGNQATATPTTDPTITEPPTSTPIQGTATPTVAIATPTPIQDCETQKINGDYNCDGAVNDQDFSDWWSDFIEKLTTLKYFEYWRRVFFRSMITPTPTAT
ncbi:MAG: hypothetical protein NUV98_02680 [Candidatus Roizmanbacteria bacterium]|nr:hypothetical protein [Candidatus Roizmanbacteria bacterium]